MHVTESVDTLRQMVNDAVSGLVSEPEPARLYDPVRYVLEGEGKRLRPVLLLLVAEAYDVSLEDALPAALAIELFHNFTLVHDDIMDSSATRRGRPTVHVKWDVDTAILCGDYLMALSYEQLAQVPVARPAQLFRMYHRMVQGLCEGQTLDKVFELRRQVSVSEYVQMVDGKTGALLGLAFEVAGYAGGAGPEARETLRAAGHDVGRAFQIQDDLLDLVAEHERWGKRVGQDLVEGKKTYLLLRALEREAEEKDEWFVQVVENDGLPVALVDEARERMDRLGVLKEARDMVDTYTSSALDRLRILPVSDAAETLHALLTAMKARLH